MCFNMYIDVCAHACLYVHFCNIPPQVLKLASLASPSPPPPPPNIEKLSRHMSQASILGLPLETQHCLLSFVKVRKDAEISNRYTQLPHLTSGSDKTQ